MAAKQKGTFNLGQLKESVEKELQRGNFREARKEARKLYRLDPNHGHLQVLARATVSRIEQLASQSSLVEARSLLNELREMGDCGPQVEAAIPKLRFLVGESVGDDSPEAQRWIADAFDKGLVQPSCVPQLSSELRTELKLVLDALTAVEENEDEKAMDLLQSISRKSPAAEWKVFIRGLIAYYTDNLDEARMNWERLSAERRPVRVAQTLMTAVERPLPIAIDIGDRLSRLNWTQGDDGILQDLKAMDDLLDQQAETEFRQCYRRFKVRHQRNHPNVVQAVIDIACMAVSDECLDALLQLGPPITGDPRGSRCKALRALRDEETTDSIQHWSVYLNDLDQIPLSDSERNIARALVHWEIAQLCRREDEGTDLLGSMMPKELKHVLREMTHTDPHEEIHFLKLAIKSWPQFVAPYDRLVEIYEAEKNWESACHYHLERCHQFPEQFDYRTSATRSLVRLRRTDEAIEQLQAAERLRPRDPSLAILRERTYFCRAFESIKQRDSAAVESSVSQLKSSTSFPYLADLISAVLLLKRKDQAAAQQLLTQVETRYPLDSTSIFCWLEVLCVLTGLPPKEKKGFQSKFQNGLAKLDLKVGIDLARMFAEVNEIGLEYVGKVTQQRLVAKYLSKIMESKSIHWNVEHIRTLASALENWDFTKFPLRWFYFLQRAIRLYPTDPFVSYWLAVAAGCEQRVDVADELQYHMQARGRLEAADPSIPELAKMRRDINARIKVAQQLLAGATFGGFPWGANFGFEFDEYDEYDDDEYYDDDEEFD